MRLRFLLLTFLFMATTACYTFYAATDCVHSPENCFPITEAYISNNDKAPTRYRLLENGLKALLIPDGDHVRTILVISALQGLLIAFTIPCLYFWLKRWLSNDRALLGVFIYVVVSVTAYHYWYLAMAVPIEVLCVLAFLLLIDRSWKALVPILIIATLTRETAVVLVGIYAAWNWQVLRQDRSKLVGLIVLFGVYAAITAAIHLVRGPSDHMLGWGGTLALNLSEFWQGGFMVNLILLPLYLVIWFGYRASPATLRRLALVAGIYVVAIVGGAAWAEVGRLFLPPLVLLLPLGLYERGVIRPTPLAAPQS